MACTCGCSPCCCTTATEVDASECTDPGIVSTAAYAGVINEDMCARRLAAFRGTDGDGNPITNTGAALRAGVQIQDITGKVKWSEAPCYLPPEDMIRVADDAQAADLANYIPFISGKNASGCEVRLVGSDDTTSGQWRHVWVSSLQMWTTVPEEEVTDLCTALMADLILDPDNTEGYLIQLETTSTISVGVSIKVGGYEMVVTEVVDEHYVRVESVSPPGSPVTINEGSSACNIGFRPCPRTEEPYADTPVFCLDDVPVSLEMPDDVNDMAVPGVAWRNQLGQWGFVAAPVDPITGLVIPNNYFATPSSPAVDGANLPGFRSVPEFKMFPQVTIFTQATGGLPTNATTTVTLSGTAGYVNGARVAFISLDMRSLITTGGYDVYIKINGEVRGHLLAKNEDGAAQYNGPFPVALDGTTEVDIEVLVAVAVGGASLSFNANVYVCGYLG